MNHTIILHRIAIYVKNVNIVKILLHNKEYLNKVKINNQLFDELYYQYGTRNFSHIIPNLPIVKSLYRLNLATSIENDSSIVEYIAEKGRIKILKWIKENIRNASFRYAANYAAENGKLRTLKWLYKHDYSQCDMSGINYTVKNQQFEVIKWIHENTNRRGSSYSFDFAAKNNDLPMLKFLHQYDYSGLFAIIHAAENGNLSIVKWLFRHEETSCTDIAISNAAANGHLHIVKWFYKNNQRRYRDWILADVIKNGHIEMAEWIYNHLLDLTRLYPYFYKKRSLFTFSKNGQLNSIKLLYQYKHLLDIIIDEKHYNKIFSKDELYKAIQIANENNYPEIAFYLHFIINDMYPI